MIHPDTLKKDWIEKVAKDNRNADTILVEKAVRALYLLEQLQKNKLNFIFKGGTSLLLLLPELKRLSIDIDIIIQDKSDNIKVLFDKIIEQTDFLEYKKDEREAKSNIEKAHYKFYYEPVTQARPKQEYILLDILYEASPYSEHVQQTAIDSSFLKSTGDPVTIMLPTCEAILGDKLTAFAPNTTGVPYGKGKEIEIIKQLYDIGNLFNVVENISAIHEVFNRVAEMELNYRDIEDKKPTDVLEDILQTCLCIATRGKVGNGNFQELQTGIQNIGNFIFSESFHLERAMLPSAKVAYLSALLKSGAKDIERFSDSTDMTDWKIEQVLTNRLNRFKKTNPEAFFYWYQTERLLMAP